MLSFWIDMSFELSTTRHPMQALAYQGSKKIPVETVPNPALTAGDDMVLRDTSSAICGSDLHI